MTQPSLLELAKQGNSKAISALLNQQLKDQGIRSRVTLKDGCLYVLLQSPQQAPDRFAMVNFVRVKIVNLESAMIQRAIVYGRKVGEEQPAWSQELTIAIDEEEIEVDSEPSQDSLPHDLESTETPYLKPPQPKAAPPQPAKRSSWVNIGAIGLMILTVSVFAYIAIALQQHSSNAPAKTAPLK
jgi:hypothetical protein